MDIVGTAADLSLEAPLLSIMPIVGAGIAATSCPWRAALRPFVLVLVLLIGCASASPALDPASDHGPPELAEGTHVVFRLDNRRYEIVVDSGGLEFEGDRYTRVAPDRFEVVEDYGDSVHGCPNGQPGRIVRTIIVSGDTLRITTNAFDGCGEEEALPLWGGPHVSTYRFSEIPEAERCHPGTYTFRKEGVDLQELEVQVECDGTICIHIDYETPFWLSTNDGMTYTGKDIFMTHPPFEVTGSVRWEQGADALEIISLDVVNLWAAGAPEGSEALVYTGTYRRVKGSD